MAVFAAVMTVSFLTHEFAQTFFAQKAGMWAEFRLTTWGALFDVCLVLAFQNDCPRRHDDWRVHLQLLKR